ncbi:transcription factor ABORTED MICROSPORES isoform X3 [Amborella trichopoda]|uniref:transcription factor ABORTED MICROSPORES isoform X3 n=1 Tax=Amborella trichopoda TaxID=13333 RepID=UPI0009BF85F3|nr:transcription factor ABORTED MICROSPORES isoform X3 [Amborella trichopoda]|eukprot:XP_020519446.1 transcription factor ABORTED MICROSPORES isoform X3 [Amborella trichopoda]
MDRASILGDAIEYVKELQMLVKALQEELDETTEEEQQQQQQGNEGDGVAPSATTPSSDSNNHGGLNVMEERVEESSSTTHHLLHIPNINNDSSDDKAQQQQMEVEVNQVSAHEFNLKIFCKKSSGGFARLMEAMDALGLEVIHVSITTYMSLVLNVFKVEDNEAIQAEHVRDSLLELTYNPNGWPSPVHKL